MWSPTPTPTPKPFRKGGGVSHKGRAPRRGELWGDSLDWAMEVSLVDSEPAWRDLCSLGCLWILDQAVPAPHMLLMSQLQELINSIHSAQAPLSWVFCHLPQVSPDQPVKYGLRALHQQMRNRLPAGTGTPMKSQRLNAKNVYFWH